MPFIARMLGLGQRGLINRRAGEDGGSVAFVAETQPVEGTCPSAIKASLSSERWGEGLQKGLQPFCERASASLVMPASEPRWFLLVPAWKR